LNFGPALPLEEIDLMVRHIEAAAMVVAGLLALAWLVCNWNDA
jgi:hypothetical protein